MSTLFSAQRGLQLVYQHKRLGEGRNLPTNCGTQEYELVGFAHTWGEHRVFFRKPADQRVYSLPAGWTDVEAPDAFVVMAAGRSLFSPTDLGPDRTDRR